MNALQLLIEQRTGKRVDNMDLWKGVQAIDHFAEEIVKGDETELEWAPHIWVQVDDLYKLLKKWE